MSEQKKKSPKAKHLQTLPAFAKMNRVDLENNLPSLSFFQTLRYD